MAFGADRSVKVNLKANISDYVGKMTAASKATKDFGQAAVSHAEKNRAAWDKVGKGMVVAGAAIGVAVVGAVKAFADFDAQMSQVRAVSGASAADMAKLTQAARDAGAGTKFSATEAAQATTELAKVGISTADILGGALTGSLNLAAAGNLDLASAAEISGQTMKIFNLQGKDVGRIADTLANGANKSAADVDTLAQALKQGGLVAAQTGLSMEDTVGTLSLFADNALMGSDAGTSFKTMLQRLTPQTVAQAKEMERLGLKFYDANGVFVGIENVAGQLQDRMKGLSTEERNAAMATIFGSDAVRAANVLYTAGAKGVHEYVKAVKEQGTAARVAAINQDNLKGDIEKLTGAISDLAIGAGEAGNGPLRDLVRSLTTTVDAVGDMPKPLQTAVFWTAALASAALVTGGAVITLVPKIAATKTALDALGVSSARAGVALKALGAAAAVIGVAVVADQLMDMSAAASVAEPKVADLAKSLGNLADGSKDAGQFGKIFQNSGLFAKDIRTASDALSAFSDSAQQALGTNFGDRIERLTSSTSMTKFTKQVDQVDAALAEMVKNGHADQAAAAYDKLMASIAAANKEGANIPVAEVAAKFGDYQAALDGAAQAQDAAAQSSRYQSDNLDVLQQNAEDAKKAIDDYVQSLQDAGLAVLSTRAAQRDFNQSVVDAKKSIEDNYKALIDQRKAAGDSEAAAKAYAEAHKASTRSLDINTEAGRNNQKALDDVARNALDLADSIYKETGSEDKMRESLLQSRASLIKTYLQFDNNKKRAEAYADSILKIPAAKNTKVTITVAQATAALQGVQTMLHNIRDKHITLTVGTVKVGNSKVNAGQFADGGYITGPGTPTSDSIPAYLSTGEYVVKASAVAKYGKTFFDQVNGMRFASGGYVARSGASGQPVAAAPVIKQDIRTDDPARAAALAVQGITWGMRTP
jgi:TP901 family phage tail tape measure protein